MSINPKPPVRYMVSTPNPPEYCYQCDPCRPPIGAEWRIVTRYSRRGVPDECAWVQWASSAEDARALARHSRANLLASEGIVYQTILRVGAAETEDGLTGIPAGLDALRAAELLSIRVRGYLEAKEELFNDRALGATDDSARAANDRYSIALYEMRSAQRALAAFVAAVPGVRYLDREDGRE